MAANKAIVVSGVFIAATALITTQTTVAKGGKVAAGILVGGYVFILLLSLLDLVPGASGLATALALTAALGIGLSQGGALLKNLSALNQAAAGYAGTKAGGG